MTLVVACDTNVLISALISAGPPARVLEAAIDGRLELVVPEVVLDELHRVSVEKLSFAEDRARAARELLAQLAVARPGRPEHVEAITGDPSDDAILACAVDMGVDLLTTGDRKHLLPVGEYRGVRVLTPQALLAELGAPS